MKHIAAITFSLTLLVLASPVLAVEPEEGAVYDTWARTDLPVLEGLASRTWMWGPGAVTEPMVEPYTESPGGLRPVQYFDKARMEITDAGADTESPWYVTNGLLVVEMVTGRVQIGDAGFEQRSPAAVNVAGDADDPDGPTYETLGGLLDSPPLPFDRPITQTLDRAGNVGNDAALEAENVQVAQIDDVTGHSIPEPFWSFMNATGTVYEDGEIVTDLLFENPYFATGRPVTEAYWARVSVAGTVKWVLVQAFERRVLTYTPDNPAGWRVEAGNVGRHYLDWRYSDDEPEPPPPPEPGETITVEVSGLEIDAGDTEGDTTYGLRFVGAASGGLEGAMEVSLDYTPPNPGPGVVNQIVGGSWSIVSDAGSLSGTVASGSATWDDGVTEAAVEATFIIAEASGAYAAYAGSGQFSGVLSHRFFPPRINGTLTFELE
jgi:hypothetical protein